MLQRTITLIIKLYLIMLVKVWDLIAQSYSQIRFYASGLTTATAKGSCIKGDDSNGVYLLRSPILRHTQS